ncbi:alpha/beta hydrolase [Candidatus Pelagibacter bacterium nBUS_32]|uniref:alpha/beta hydrolase n=1 Tax=Candidatus Pelagibacter bacterium nBUS_32 TaxID=3374192 RepID=UPI003EBF6823
MNNFRYHQISKNKKIRYIYSAYKNTPFIVFLHGFMSDLEGKKPNVFLRFAKKNKISFLALEYSGHGKSSGNFINGNITKWSNETSALIKKYVKKNNFTIIGSSMGAWIAIKQFQKFKNQINSFLGIGSAPEFLENLIWKKFTKKMKAEIIKKGIYHLKHGNYEYPITHQLIKDGRKNKVLNKKINSKIKITMVHGQKDEVVPVSYSRKVLKIFKNAKKKLLVIKGGDHSLSETKWLKKILQELRLII